LLQQLPRIRQRPLGYAAFRDMAVVLVAMAAAGLVLAWNRRSQA